MNVIESENGGECMGLRVKNTGSLDISRTEGTRVGLVSVEKEGTMRMTGGS
jgi:hypothetical protein